MSSAKKDSASFEFEAQVKLKMQVAAHHNLDEARQGSGPALGNLSEGIFLSGAHLLVQVHTMTSLPALRIGF